METEERKEIMSLPQLQNLMKRDPEAYKLEFEQQWEHFSTMMEMFQLKPQRPHKNFGEQVMFLAHVAPCFPDHKDRLPEVLIKSLQEHYQVLHVTIRRTLVSALILLRNRHQFALMKVLPLYFKLFTVEDRVLRQIMFTHIVRDIAAVNLKSKHQKTNREIQNFLIKSMRDNDENVSRRAAAVLIALNRQGVWTDGPFTNLLSQALLSPDVKISAALAHLFLGNKTQGLEGILAEDEDEEELEKQAKKEASEVANSIVGAKKTKNRVKRLKRAKKHAQKLMTKGKKKSVGSTGHVSFAAIDLLNDAHGLAERLLQRLSKGNEPFMFRILLLHLVGRLVGRHQLLLLNLYPYIMKYLQPNQREVSKFLACLAEAIHPEVPPEELKNVIDHIMRHFVTEAVAPEVMQVGINSLRELATRAPHCLGEEELTDLCGYKKFKNKGVMMSVRSLINTFREINPTLLHRSLRGKEASIAISRGEDNKPVFGTGNVRDNIDGLELLARKSSFKPGKEEEEGSDAESASGTVSWHSGSEGEDEEGLSDGAEDAESEEELDASGSEDAQEDGEEEDEQGEEEEEMDEAANEDDGEDEAKAGKEDPPKASAMKEARLKLRTKKAKAMKEAEEKRKATKARAKTLATECVLGPKDFQKLRRARLQQSVELQMGRKRKIDELSFSDSDSGSDDSDGSEKGTGAGDLPGGVCAEELQAARKRGRTKAHRMEIIKKGRVDWWEEKKRERKDNRKGGTTNKEKVRNKPQMMSKDSKASRRKRNFDLKTKTKNLKKHIKNLGKKVGGKVKRRRN